MWSTVATSSASRRGWLSGRTWTAIPILTRRVQAASAEAMTSGAARTDRSFWKWISANHTASKPKSSAALICASASSNAAASVTPGGLGNSVNRPNSIPPSRSNSVYPTPEHPVTGGQEWGVHNGRGQGVRPERRGHWQHLAARARQREDPGPGRRDEFLRDGSRADARPVH